MIKTLLTTACVSLGVSLIGTTPTLAGGFFIDSFNSSSSPGAGGAAFSINGTVNAPYSAGVQAFEPPQRLLTTSDVKSGTTEIIGLDTKNTIGGTRNLSLNVDSAGGASNNSPVTSRVDVISGEDAGILNFTANAGVQATATLSYRNTFSEQPGFFKNVTDRSAILVSLNSLTAKDASFNFTLMDRSGAMSTVTLTKDDYIEDKGLLLVMLDQFKGINLDDIVATDLSITQTADANSMSSIEVDSIVFADTPEPPVVVAFLVTGAAAVFLKRRRPR